MYLPVRFNGDKADFWNTVSGMGVGNISVPRTTSIVDDDPLVRDATVDLLNSLGYSALAFGSAEEFLDSRSGRDDVVSDHRPATTGAGWTWLAELIGYQWQLCCGDFHHRISGCQCSRTRDEAGSIAFLPKPYEEGDLVQAIHIALVR